MIATALAFEINCRLVDAFDLSRRGMVAPCRVLMRTAARLWLDFAEERCGYVFKTPRWI
jgi:hypothetical protein